MKIEQFFDENLAQLSYAILSDNEIALIDPGRDTKPYYEFALKHDAKITMVFETHLHADFVSSHAEFGRAGILLYVSKLAEVNYLHKSFDEGQEVTLGKVKLRALNTPGHSPDSISILLLDEVNREHAIFTGDTLFIGDVGRPDLRENVGNIRLDREILARHLYHSLHEKILQLSDDVIVYPAHGHGSLCGKDLSKKLSDTLGNQKQENYALKPIPEDEFVKILLKDQPEIPAYFPYDVELNRIGAPDLQESLNKVPIVSSEEKIQSNAIVIDTRPEKDFKAGHISGAINIQNALKFETWLGSVVLPTERFYIIAADEESLNEVILKSSKIGYELNIVGALAQNSFSEVKSAKFDLEAFERDFNNYTIVDVRNKSEVLDKVLFENSINIPLGELRQRINEIPDEKPIVVNCSGGYRSAIGFSILESYSENPVYDLGKDVKDINVLEFYH